eukprot:CAMPEP_0171592056 /NCGR_PEP_ID=MMETSP0961-20121227/16622_1 /TAXON_ID=87120 /ORGANISM="Aurantiochytrium limacinum, Strain ATCCMYA-1381" /LENGTH=680 /DNA_ID=CAMNT_0012152283 /DNA_START=158 /DNA_END=2197 /DNA_ORIENTATION=-
MEDLSTGLNDWRNIQDVVRKTFKSLHDVVRSQGEKIRHLEQKLANTPTGGEFENLQVSMANKPTFAELNKHLSVRFEEMGLAALRSQVSSKADKVEMKELYTDMTTATQRMAESNNALELLVRQQQGEIEALKRQIRGLSNIQAQEEDMHAKFATRKWVEEMLDFEAEARKQALANVRKELAERAVALEKRINTLPTVEDLDEVLSQKADMDTLAKALKDRPTQDDVTKEIQNRIMESANHVQEQVRAIELALTRTKAELERVEDSMVDFVSRSELLEVCGQKVGGPELDERMQESSEMLTAQFKEAIIGVQRELVQVINKKAFKTDVQRQLGSKANTDDVTNWLSSKVELADVRDALAHKSDLTVMQGLADRVQSLERRHARAGSIPPAGKRRGRAPRSDKLDAYLGEQDEFGRPMKSNNKKNLGRRTSSEFHRNKGDESSDFDDENDEDNEDYEDHEDGDFEANLSKQEISRLLRRLAKLDADKVSVKDLCLLLDQKANIKDVNDALAQLSTQQSQAAASRAQRDEDSIIPQETVRQLRREVDAIGEAMNAELSVGRWIWSSGRVLSDRAVPWNIECVNTATENLHWTKDSADLTAIMPGLYELHLGFFSESDPEVQVLVNGEAILYTVSRPRDKKGVKTHGAALAPIRRAKHSAGNVTGWTLNEFVALPARARLTVI